MEELKVGTCGWGYFKPWKYGLKGDKLKAYAELFPVVEVNSTFYSLPNLNIVKRWRRNVPETFEFTVKHNREVTHVRFFKNVDDVTEHILSIMKTLRSEWLLIQTPKSFVQTSKHEQLVKDYVSTLGVRAALELRGWKPIDVGVWVTDPQREVIDQPIQYFRVHGRQANLDIIRERTRGERGFLFFNTRSMYDDAINFMKKTNL